MNKEDAITILHMICLIAGCCFIGLEFGANIGLGLFLILITFA